MKLIAVILSLLLCQTGLTYFSDNGRGGNDGVTQRSGACAPASSRTYIEINNVRALIETGGRMWQDRATGTASYEVPAGSNKFAIFSGALWLGGVDFNNQLRLAAHMFGGGNDFWPGALQTDNTATISADQCLYYDKFYHVTRAEVAEFVTMWKEGFPAPYQIPASIMNWKAHGGPGEDYFMAPFHDENGDLAYNPLNGDYPLYDFSPQPECYDDRDGLVPLFGDETYWWVFNDKGSIHTESGGDPVGFEIRAQAFGFATNDEINNMTFYNYEIHNRSTYTLYNTYFGQWVDPDIGDYSDDFVGCDVARGLGYCYNGKAIDEGPRGYGANPPAIGIDFFQGPYMDYDGIDNPGPTADNNYFVSYQDAIQYNGIPYKGIGLGYGDGKVDNERYGMRSFFYFTGNGAAPEFSDPVPGNSQHFYNYLTGYWRNGQGVTYGGQGTDPNGIPTNYCFPGTSDPVGWATGGIPQPDWTEVTAGNPPGDRRMVLSAGPFTLEPGAKNNLTVGVVYARSSNGDPWASVQSLKLADDKAQALFDNCFRIMEGPHAPEVAMQELDKELIISLSNDPASNNYKDQYEEKDPFLPDSVINELGEIVAADKNYRFQGYIVFQVKNEEVSVSDVYNISKSRPVFQCDIKDSVTQLINFLFDEQLGVSVPQEMVNGANEGVKHSFSVKEDMFADGDKRLINYKKYHYIAVAYAHNEYKKYDPDNPTALDGQKVPFVMSRKSLGGSIKFHTGIPHIPTSENNGTVVNSEHGDTPEITRVEGQGNGGRVLRFTEKTEDFIVNNYYLEHATYAQNFGPIDLYVVDPLSVPNAVLELRFLPDDNGQLSNESPWTLTNTSTGETIASDFAIGDGYDQLIPEYGLALRVDEPEYFGSQFQNTEYLHSDITFSVPTKPWLSGLPDIDDNSFQNWIRIGSQSEAPFEDYGDLVVEEAYEQMIDGTWSLFKAIADTTYSPAPIKAVFTGARNHLKLKDYHSVDIVITSDKSKWTRCPVIETCPDQDLSAGSVEKGYLRNAPSVDMNGDPDGSGNGMGWFPGYAIDLETGERLNMAFGENSWLPADNGADMLWNPTSRVYTQLGQPVFGGGHYIYVFKNRESNNLLGRYNGGYNIEQLMNADPMKVWRTCMWTTIPLLSPDHEFLSSDVRVTLQVKQRHSERYIFGENNGFPMYRADLGSLAVTTEELAVAEDALSIIGIVPNPYYGYSHYEANKVDTRVKITNLPKVCSIRIYTSSGTLVRDFSKDSDLTFFEWDLKNHAGIPVSSGTYIIHINAPGIGERVIKWFGVMRSPDLENF